jgi:hypothetical protein
MTVSDKFRRQLAEDARAFHELWRHASRYAKAGNPEMARRIIDSAPVRTSAGSAEEQEWCLRQAQKAMLRIQLRDNERRQQGLPPFEPPVPSIH